MSMYECGNPKMEVCPIKNVNVCCAGCDEIKNCEFLCPMMPKNSVCDYAEATEIVPFESKAASVIGAMADLLVQKKKLEEKEKEVRKKLTKAMDEYGVKSFENDRLKITHIEATTKKSFDSKKLKKDHPDLYDEYVKETNVSASVRIQLKEGD